MEAFGGRISGAAVDDTMARAVNDRRMKAMFHRRAGRAPRPGELETILQEAGDAYIRSGAAHVVGMLHVYNSSLEYLQDYNVEFLSAHRAAYGFVTSDNPVVIARGEGMLEVDGEHSQFAIGDSRYVYVPARRDLGIGITKGSNWQGWVDTATVVRLNNTVWRGCVECVGAHPTEDWSRACGGVGQRVMNAATESAAAASSPGST
jgi:hypothetical protein